MTIESRKQGPRSPAGAVIALAAGLVIAAALALILVRIPGEGGPDRPVAARAPEPAPAAAIEPEPVAEPVPVVEPEPELAAWPQPSDATVSLERAVADCPAPLLQMNFGERMLAIDASPSGLDFIVEYESKPNRYVRLTCRWTGDAWQHDAVGRVSMPSMVGDAARFPDVLLPPAGHDVAWYRARIAAARRAAGDVDAASVARVEAAFVDGRALARVRFDGGRDVILDGNGASLAADTPFPQVERVRNVPPQDADLGFRDMKRTTWTAAFASRLERLAPQYVAADERLHKIYATEDWMVVTVHKPDFPGQYRDKSIDEYGDMKVDDVENPWAVCAKPFTIAEARAMLDAAIAARGGTRAQFAETSFAVVNLNCRDGKGPEFQFD